MGEKELKESENVTEDESLEEEWPSLSLEGMDGEKELKEVPKKDIQSMDILKKEKDPKSDKVNLENDALQNSSSFLGELRFSDSEPD